MTSPSAGPAIYWDGRLSQLLSTLTDELQGAEPDSWARRTVTGGFLVALTTNERGQRLLRISHATRPVGGKHWKAFEADVERIQQHLGAGHWERKTASAIGTGAAVWLEEPTVMP